ncbi:MAG: DinB family protein [Acidimicrobiales bacterium]
MGSEDQAAAIGRLRATARELVALTASVSGVALAQVPGPGEWSAAAVMAHLADTELMYSVRLRIVLTSERPYLVAFDEEAWTERFGGLDGDPKVALARWRPLREANVKLFESLDEPEWARVGVHAERGPMTVGGIAALLVDHDRQHLDQIRRALAASLG